MKTRSLFLLFTLGLLLAAGLPAVAGFVTVETFAGEVSSVVAGNHLFVGRHDKPSVLVYDHTTGVQVMEISLLGVAGQGPPVGTVSLTLASDSSLIIGTKPFGELFRINNLSAASIGVLPPYPGGETVVEVTALKVVGGRLYIGARPAIDTQTCFFRSTTDIALTGMEKIIFPDTNPNFVTGFAVMGSTIAVATADTPVSRGSGRLYLYDPTTETPTRNFIGDSMITALEATHEHFYFGTSDAGEIRRATDSSTVFATVPETIVRTILFVEDGSESVLFVGSETSTLRRLSSAGVLSSKGTVDSRALSVRALAFVRAPERVYGVATTATGSLLFYYDTTAPQAISVTFYLDTSRSSAGSPETYTPPLTWGDFVMTVITDEELSIAPTVTLTYPDGTTQVVTMGGSGRSWSGDFTIPAARSGGYVVVTIIMTDPAGNIGSTILSGGSFPMTSLPSSLIADNLIRPNLGERARIRYFLFTPQNVVVKVYNMRGIEVADISPGYRAAGQYEDVTWGGFNSRGNTVASGVYLVRIEAGGEFKATHKVMLVR